MSGDSRDEFDVDPEELRKHFWGNTGIGDTGVNPQDARPVATLISGADLALEPYRWVWMHWLARGKLEILGGAVATGKTTIAVGMAATITSGGMWPDGSYAEPGDVVMWSGEDAASDTLLPRFLAAGGIREKIHFVGKVIAGGKKRAFNPSTDMPALVEATKRIKTLGMVLIDPVVMMITGDSHKNAEVRRGLQPLVDLAGERNVVALGITHLTKGTAGRDPIERLTGSLAFGAGPRLVLLAAKPFDPEMPRRLVRVKSNLGPDGDGFEYSLAQVLIDSPNQLYGQKLVWGDPLYRPARELLNGVEVPKNDLRHHTPARNNAMSFLVTILENGPMPAQWIKAAAKDAGLAWRTVERACKDLNIVISRIGGFGSEGSWQWELPKDLKPGEETDL